MIGENCEPFEMIEERDESLRKDLPHMVGPMQYKHMTSPSCGTYMNFLGYALFSKKSSPECFYLDKEKLNALKESAKGKNGVEYVSTNDIITSGFGKTVKAKLLTMGMDFRGRINGLTKRHAGNYHLGVLWDHEGYATPHAIRGALNGEPPYSRAENLPGCSSCQGNWNAMISNWSSISKGAVNLPKCEQTLSIPYVNVNEAIVDMCVVFNAKPGQVAIMVFLHNHSLEDLRRELPVGGCVSKEMFAQ